MKELMSLGLAAALGLFAAGARAARTGAEQAIQGWPDASRRAAQMMMEKYGEPDTYSSVRVEWRNRGPFKRIAVNGTTNPLGVVENTVDYEVPAKGIGLLSLRDCYVVPDEGAGEMTAFSGREELNLLGLNIANEVMLGRMDAKQAREFQSRTLGLRAAGKSSPYMERLMFRVKTETNSSSDEGGG